MALKPWTDDDCERLVRLVKGYGRRVVRWTAIGKAFPGRTWNACQRQWRRLDGHGGRRPEPKRRGRPPRERDAPPRTRRLMRYISGDNKVLERLLAERDARDVADTRTEGERAMGDPGPGRSALAKRRG